MDETRASGAASSSVSSSSGEGSQVMVGIEPAELASQRGGPSTNRLRSASRAVQFLRRAANSLLTRGTNLPAASNLLEQDGSTSSLAGSTSTVSWSRRRRLRQLAASSSNDSLGRRQASGESPSAPATNTGGADLLPGPAFLVPKSNGLRLPIMCMIRSLEGELMREIFVHRYELGQYLLENLKASLGIEDCAYLGLRFARSLEEQEDLRNPWLKLNESVFKQIKAFASSGHQNHEPSTRNVAQSGAQSHQAGSPRSVDLYLRIKFYPAGLARVQDPFLRHYLWLQLRRDLRLGKLTSSMGNLSQLLACLLQHDLGDFKAELAQTLGQLRLMPNQDLVEGQALEVWQTRLTGQLAHQAQMQFLRSAIILETYGFDYWPVRDHQRQRAYLLGFNYAGVKTIKNGRIVHHFRWNCISKISYERRMIIFHVYASESSKRKQILGFKCLSNEDCTSLYLQLLYEKYFLTVDLAYFDKSLRRPSMPLGAPDWNSTGGGDQPSGEPATLVGQPSEQPTSETRPGQPAPLRRQPHCSDHDENHYNHCDIFTARDQWAQPEAQKEAPAQATRKTLAERLSGQLEAILLAASRPRGLTDGLAPTLRLCLLVLLLNLLLKVSDLASGSLASLLHSAAEPGGS